MVPILAGNVPAALNMDLPVARWNSKGLLFCQLAALFLLATWLWEPTRHLWDALDNAVLHHLNASLTPKSAWSALCALANVRWTDIAVGLTMLVPLLRRDWIDRRYNIREMFCTFAALLALMLVLRVAFHVISSTAGIVTERTSPSLQYPEIVRLSELYPHWNVKDSSGSSFPGDHASVLFIWAMFLSLLTGGWRLAVVWSMAFVYMLPRLFAGAHWTSDDFVGGLFIGLLAFGWGCHTPLASACGKWLAVKIRPVLARPGRWPLLRKMAFFSEQEGRHDAGP